jgi:SAM-dependent methyltransferase
MLVDPVVTSSIDRRKNVLRRLGIRPRPGRLVHAALRDAIARAEAEHGDEIVAEGAGRVGVRPVVALDAGCGRRSALARYRSRIGRFIGADIHAPAHPLAYLDEFVTTDLCETGDAFPPGTFDVILSSFTVEHFAAPAVAFRNFHRWLRPGGTLVLTTVNRRNPFVAAYFGLPTVARDRIQPVLKETAADAHPLVGACNDPATLRSALASAGFVEIRLRSVCHLARAWSRHLPTFLFGLAGDILTRDLPSRRSTLVVSARTPV